MVGSLDPRHVSGSNCAGIRTAPIPLCQPLSLEESEKQIWATRTTAHDSSSPPSWVTCAQRLLLLLLVVVVAVVGGGWLLCCCLFVDLFLFVFVFV